MKTIDSARRKTIFDLTNELIQTASRPWESFLGRGKSIHVKDLDAGERLGGVLANDDPEELKRQESQYWGTPDETRDATDYERLSDLEDLAKDNFLDR